MSEVAIATEDQLSESVSERLIEEAGLSVNLRFGKQGFGYLKKNISKFRQIAALQPVVILTDLDSQPCPQSLIDDWLGNQYLPENFIFRVVVREIEAWLLADDIGMKRFLGGKVRQIPGRPDELPDPKMSLLKLAYGASRDVRYDLVPAKGAIASQGFGYNSRLSEFVRGSWSPARASAASPSLARARARIAELRNRLPN